MKEKHLAIIDKDNRIRLYFANAETENFLWTCYARLCNRAPGMESINEFVSNCKAKGYSVAEVSFDVFEADYKALSGGG
jgi:hypothetical protein